MPLAISANQHRALKRLYYKAEEPGSLGGINRFFRAARAAGIKVSENQVRDFLSQQDTYTLHRPVRKHFKRRQTVVGGIDHQWQADLADMTDLAKSNDGFRYLLTVVDCFSKFAWAIPVRTKDGAAMVAAFKDLFEQSHPRQPKKLQTDKGKEFFNKEVQGFLARKKISHFATESDTKAAMVERFNRTLKTKMWAYFTAKNTDRFLEVLPKLLLAYNHSLHRTIGMKPADVKMKDEERLWHRVYGVGAARGMRTNKVKKQDIVRIPKYKSLFEKGYLPNWTGEYFKVSDVKSRPAGHVYKLRDTLGEDIAGTFYPEEVQKIFKFDDDEYEIEKVIRTRKLKDGKKQFFVKWQHWPDKFNSWVNEEDMGKR